MSEHLTLQWILVKLANCDPLDSSTEMLNNFATFSLEKVSLLSFFIVREQEQPLTHVPHLT